MAVNLEEIPAGASVARAFAARAGGGVIGGEVVAARDGGGLEVQDPVTEDPLAEVACAGPQTVDAAVRAARAAFAGAVNVTDPRFVAYTVREPAGVCGQVRGHFLEPAVLTGATPDMGIWREEVFGPVVTVTPFDGADEGVALANDTRYGLAAAVWTGDAGRGIALARRLRAGTVWVNEYGAIRPEVPFGGFGEHGVGRELGALGLDACTEPKSVFVAL